MSRRLRWLPKPSTTFEITCKAFQSRMLLRPSAELNDLLLGIIGRALSLYPVMLHLITVASNHIHLIVTVDDVGLLSDFMCYLNGNLAREAGKLHRWKEKFWGRRFTAIPIADELSLVQRVRYLLSHGCKEGLVLRPGDWPGVQCVRALVEGQEMSGTWYDRTAHYESGRRGENRPLSEFAIRYPVPLTTLPMLEYLSPEQRKEWYGRMVKDIEEETAERIRREGRGVMGVKRVLRQRPHEHPRKIKRSPAPLCHCTDHLLYRTLRDEYRWFRDLYRAASSRLRDGDLSVRFPDNCFPPAPACNRLAESMAPP